jgi:hypothetical protein
MTHILQIFFYLISIIQITSTPSTAKRVSSQGNEPDIVLVKVKPIPLSQEHFSSKKPDSYMVSVSEVI